MENGARAWPGEAERHPVAVAFALGLLVGGGIGWGALLLLPVPLPLLLPAGPAAEAHAAPLPEGNRRAPERPERMSVVRAASKARSARPAGLLALGGPAEEPAAAEATRRIWWKIPMGSGR
jgi:hypothetical protein